MYMANTYVPPTEGADPVGIGIRVASFPHVIYFSDFLCFDMSLLLLTVTLRGYLISIAYCLFFHFVQELWCRQAKIIKKKDIQERHSMCCRGLENEVKVVIFLINFYHLLNNFILLYLQV